jgi:hypothetical protein
MHTTYAIFIILLAILKKQKQTCRKRKHEYLFLGFSIKYFQIALTMIIETMKSETPWVREELLYLP